MGGRLEIIPAAARPPEGASSLLSAAPLRLIGAPRWLTMPPDERERAVDGRFWLLQTFNGLSYGALLFLLGSGLSLIFGVMRIVNLAHGAYFLLGGYVALSVI